MGIIYKYKPKKYNIENSNNIDDFNDIKNNSIQIFNPNKYNTPVKIENKIKDFSDLSPFYYYISNGNKVSKNM